MNVSTTGLELRSRSRALREAVELLSSMRFSISLLTLICIASIVGTVVKQQEPFNNYVNQFGPFWAELFATTGLYAVYGTWWFLLILAFLVASTSLCIARNAPKIFADLRQMKEHLREQALQAFHHKAQGRTAEPADAALARVAALLQRHGWRAKVDVRAHGTMVAARKGAASRLGYLSAHGAIVLICLGGLADGNLVVKLQMALQGKTAYDGGGLLKDVAPAHRLSPATPTFRGNLLVAEGGRSGTALLNLDNGVVVQELPFDVELKKFIVEYYATGMPKLFASEIVIHDRETGRAIPATVKVNEPAHHRGVNIYQSSFDDGGSSVTLRALPLQANGKPFELTGTIGSGTRLANGDEQFTLEYTALRVINVENLGGGDGPAAADVRKVDLASTLSEHLGAGDKVRNKRELRNVGPSIMFKLRDAAGQAREYHNYMQPVDIDGQRMFLAGVRDTPNEAFRFLRIPADTDDSLDGWVRLKRALSDAALRDEAVKRYVAQAAPADKPEMAEQLSLTARRALALFAGAERVKADAAPGGLAALSDFLEASVPADDRVRISEVLLRIVNGSLLELADVAREREKLPPLPRDERTQAFMTQSVLALSDSAYYPSPLLLELASFKQVQASVFQVARAPGQTLVYLGAVLLIVGVFAMLYVRERRLWVWLQPDGGGTRVSAALSTARRTFDADTEFEKLKRAILQPGATT
jgi:cytochrome c biogenesis protein